MAGSAVRVVLLSVSLTERKNDPTHGRSATTGLLWVLERLPCAMARKRKKGPKGRAPDGRRKIGFHCAWCHRNNPWNERFVPLYYIPPEGHGHGPLMCYSCYLEGAGKTGKKQHPTKLKPRLNAETLTAFWLEDISDGGYIRAAARFFQVSQQKVRQVMQDIKITGGRTDGTRKEC